MMGHETQHAKEILPIKTLIRTMRIPCILDGVLKMSKKVILIHMDHGIKLVGYF